MATMEMTQCSVFANNGVQQRGQSSDTKFFFELKGYNA